MSVKRIVSTLCGVVGLLAGSAALGAPAFGYGGEPHFPEIAVSASVAPAGGTLTVVGDQFTPHGAVDLSLHSSVVELGRLTADRQGEFSAQITIPADEVAGGHTIEAIDAATGDFATASITVIGQEAGVPPPPNGGGLAGTGVAVAGLLLLAVVLLVGGKVLTAVGRRRSVRI